MRVLVVYESIWGNTAAIAETIAHRLGDYGDVRLVPVLEADAAMADGVDLLVVGGPTHMHGLSRPSSRKSGIETERISGASSGPGVREWLQSLPEAKGAWATAFDTRLDKPRWLVGAASGPIARRLRARGYRQIAPAESFVVTGGDGPLKAGERERADAWAELIADRICDALSTKPLATDEHLDWRDAPEHANGVDATTT
jgi:hypothetical protein